MDTVHESGIVTHLRRHWPEKVPHSLLVLHVHFKIAHHHHAAIGSDALPPPAKFPRLHVALHDVDAVLLIERDAGDFIKTDHVVLTDQSPLTGGIVDEHPGNGCLPPEIRWAYGETCWNKWLFPVLLGPSSTML